VAQWFPVVLGLMGVLLAEVLLLRLLREGVVVLRLFREGVVLRLLREGVVLRLLREGVVLLLHPARAGRQQLQVVRFAAPYLPSLYS
jgi:hypothetical protein